MKIYKQNPYAKPIFCPKLPFEESASYAVRPLSTCMDCPHMSNMNCGASNEISLENPAKSAKNYLQWF